jgi:hypothetical protein
MGYYCADCDLYYTLDEKPYTVNMHSYNQIVPSEKNYEHKNEPWPGFGPGTFALPRQRSTRLSYQGNTNTLEAQEETFATTVRINLAALQSSVCAFTFLLQSCTFGGNIFINFDLASPASSSTC